MTSPRPEHWWSFQTTGMFGILLVLLAMAGLASLTIGAVHISVADAVAVVFGQASDPITRTIIIELRLPRVLLAILIGIALGTTGCAYQALFRNPLADPFVVGASSGAAVGAALVIVSGWAGKTAGFGPASIGAFVGALLAVWMVYAIAAVGRMPPVTLLLAGYAVSTILAGAVWLMMALADEQMPRIVAWLMGGLASRGWETLAGAWPVILIGAIVLCLLGRPLDALCGGEEVARSLGLRVGALTAIVLLAANLAVAASVAAGGVIGFVGLVAPHLARPLVGSAHARLIPASGLVGAILMLAADAVARTAAAPVELPLGVVTAVLGGPVFLFVLRRTAVRAAEEN